MVASMTGFGRGEVESNGFRASVEVRSVNGRYGEVAVRLPRTLVELEQRIKEVVLAAISRGRIDVSVSLQGEAAEQGVPALNLPVLDAYRRELEALRERLGLAGQISAMDVAQLPGVFNYESKAPDPEAIWAAIGPACEAAVAQCQGMRRAEGERLARDFAQRIQILESLLEKVEQLAPRRVETIRQKLQEKLGEFLGPEQVDQTRLLMEVAILAERSDVTEECVRFHSHNAQFLQTLERDEAVGRRLNFLLQEMLREANTIGSKAGDSEIAHLVVEIKEEIEKLKEQALNVE